MIRTALALAAVGLAFTPLAAREGPQLILADGESVEVDIEADLNADGVSDVAYVARADGRRELRVVTSHVSATEFGENPVQVLQLDAYPLGEASLAVDGNVLLFADLSGGTTAVASTHRFRWDTKLGAMQLIGLDATLYSRTYAHDGREASWNLLTGDFVTQTLQLRKSSSDIAYDEVNRKRRKKRSAPLRLEQSPSGDESLEWPFAGQDR